ncbi:MAG: SpoIIE family protein phosphatase [Thermoanaerobaculaceae bacterium]|nr:SpoIIE family protein phosphatase [Thermoanaerobaculaceae bacterium]MDI9621362.1 SpoIIE family protein phosphatase [Acidobacteriota bacterium]NLH10361.1 SpoIIE family protein phosphatase [Holophagae bacterium]HPW56294.1 SpoIIE family protein phosphatase [Thermoanaerobaculaceae bacterium]
MVRKNRDATWSSQPFLLPRDPSLARGRLRVDSPVLLIGRDPASDIVISHPTVSRRHAKLEWNSGQLTVEDLGSSGGTFINGVRVRRERLAPGDVLRLGPSIEYAVGVGSASTPLALAAKRETAEEEVKHLQVLLDVARALNAATVLDEVQEIVLQAAVRIMKADRGSVVLFDALGQLRTAAVFPPDLSDGGWAEHSSLLERAVRERKTVCTGEELSPSQSMILRGAAMAVATPLMVARRPIGAPEDASFVAGLEVLGGVLVERSERGQAFSRNDLAVLESVAADTASAIDSAKLYREAREKAKIDHEMGLARSIQAALLRKPEVVDFAETYAFSQSARAVGGDLVHTMVRGDGGFAVAVGDVSGKGVSAALIMAMVQGFLGILHELGLAVREVPDVVNRNLSRYSVGNRFITLVAGVLYANGRLELANAGHAPVSILRRDGRIETLNPHGPMLGLLDGVSWEWEEVWLEPDDVVVMVSDGLTESFSALGEEFGLEGVQGVLEAQDDRSPVRVGQALLEAASRHRGGREASDDVTLLVLRYRPPADAAGG